VTSRSAERRAQGFLAGAQTSTGAPSTARRRSVQGNVAATRPPDKPPGHYRARVFGSSLGSSGAVHLPSRRALPFFRLLVAASRGRRFAPFASRRAGCRHDHRRKATATARAVRCAHPGALRCPDPRSLCSRFASWPGHFAALRKRAQSSTRHLLARGAPAPAAPRPGRALTVSQVSALRSAPVCRGRPARAVAPLARQGGPLALSSARRRLSVVPVLAVASLLRSSLWHGSTAGAFVLARCASLWRALLAHAPACRPPALRAALRPAYGPPPAPSSLRSGRGWR
jgi:hypothetical protein